MVTEDYVSYETARLLRDKGFDGPCYACYEYFKSNVTLYSGWPFEYKGVPVHNSNDRVKCPTLQMAIKWFRKEHNIHIEGGLQEHINTGKFLYRVKVFDPTNLSWKLNAIVYNWNSYEEACEAGIKYCLEYLYDIKKMVMPKV